MTETREELETVRAVLADARKTAAPHISDNYVRLMSKVIHSIELKIDRIGRGLLPRNPRGRPRKDAIAIPKPRQRRAKFTEQ